ncbi:MAG: hypothetical protein ACE5EG_00500 [Thermoanaerobaculia bacterium]
MRGHLMPESYRAAALAAVLTLTATAARCSDSAEIARRMIGAHGGMEAWAGAPTVAFTDEFRPGGVPSGFPGRIVVEQGSRRARLDYGNGMQASWDGEKAWSLNWMSPAPPRFLALLNYYFANLPWLTQDDGVNLGEPGTARLWDDPTEYITVKMTFGPGVGDTPDDYYVLYIHPETHRLHANEYIVTYRSILPEGVTASDPKILVYDEYTEVDGLVVPAHYTIYTPDGSVYATCVFTDWSFDEAWDEAWMEMPEGAVVDNTQP